MQRPYVSITTEIKVKFVKGVDLIVAYPTGRIPSKDFVKLT